MKTFTARSILPVAILCLIGSSLPGVAQTFQGRIGVGLEGMGGGSRSLWNVDCAKTHRSWQAPGLGATLSAANLDANGDPLHDAGTVLFDYRPVAEWSGSIDDPQIYRLNVS